MTRPQPTRPAGRTNLLALLLLTLAAAACRDDAEPAGASAPRSELPDEVARALPPVDPDRPAVLFEEALPPLTDWLSFNLERRDAELDGWTTEVLHERARAALGAILDAWLVDGSDAGDLLDPAVELSALVPDELETLLSEDGITVRRGRPSGRLGFGRDAIAELVAELGPGARPVELEIVSIEHPDGARLRTRALVQIENVGAGERIQHDLTLRLEWIERGSGLALSALETLAYDRVRFAARPLVDVSEAVFGRLDAWPHELLLGVEHYHLATDKLIGQSFLGMQGLAVGDVNGDGLDDVYVCQQAALPNRLLVRRPDGSLEDRSHESNLALIDRTRSALILDLDGDGARDVALAVGPLLVIAFNHGEGTFSEPDDYVMASGDGPSPPDVPAVVLPCPDESEIYGLNAADVDQDGDLDLYVMRYGVGGVTGSVPTPYHDARNGSTNLLWRNEGRRSFSDATAELGLDEGNDRYSLASVFEDFDQDGDLDLYVTNDFGRNNYYEYEDGRFRDVADRAGALDQAAGMGATVADIELDGDPDVLISNMFSSAGLRIASQPGRYMGGEHRELHDDYVYHARGNTLLTNRGDGTFDDATETAGVALGRWAWGAFFFDLNADGLEDIYVPNGFVTNRDPEDLHGFFWRRVTSQSPAGVQPTADYENAWSSIQYMVRYTHASWNGRERNCVYLNLGDGRFADVSRASGGDWIDDSRTVVPLDWDADGRLDLLLKNRTGPRVRLLRNVAPRRHWLTVRLEGTAPNVDAIGASVELELANRVLRKSVRAAEGFLGQASRELYFGLGDATAVARLRVRWPDGAVTVVTDPAIDGTLAIDRSTGDARVLERPYAGCLDDVAAHDVVAPEAACRRLVLGSRLPLAPIAVPSFDEPGRIVRDLTDRGPILIDLWATWCAPCQGELTELHERADEVAASGLNVVPLSTDSTSDLAKARRMMQALGFELAGYADQRALAQIQIVLLDVLGTYDEIPLPTSFLLDEKGQLVVVYLGPPGVDRLLKDVESLKRMNVRTMVPRRLLGGPWFGAMPRNLARVRRMFARTGFEEAAEYYQQRVRAQRGMPPLAPDGGR